MPQIIPLPIPSPTPPGAIVREVTLSDFDVQIELMWNQRIERWTINLLDEAGDPVIAGKTLEVGVLLNDGYTGTRWPPGLLVAFREGEGVGTVGREELGAAVKLAWYSADEIEADLLPLAEQESGLTVIDP